MASASSGSKRAAARYALVAEKACKGANWVDCSVNSARLRDDAASTDSPAPRSRAAARTGKVVRSRPSSSVLRRPLEVAAFLTFHMSEANASVRFRDGPAHADTLHPRRSVALPRRGNAPIVEAVRRSAPPPTKSDQPSPLWTTHMRRSKAGGTVFVGREGELAQLVDALESSFSGLGRLILLAGEPGIGKSRLA